MNIFILYAAGFLIGSIPTGQLIARSRGIDLRKKGSGNIGATNVLRTAGRWPAIFTLVGDIAKGAAAVLLGRHFGAGPVQAGVIGLCAILGHNFSLFLKFRGGKGVATSIGVLSVYSPQTGLFTIIIWLMTVFISRYSSLAALVSFGILPLSISLLDTREKLPVALVMTALIFIRHRENIARLARGQEPKVGSGR
ncbi:MAG: glycerol-3-phosphate 1-O-acyltransferase PlsY [Candidatus Sulfobium sp.]